MNNTLLASAVATALVVAPAAGAGTAWKRYDGTGFYDHAEVVGVQPITRSVRVSTPRRECWEEEVRHPAQQAQTGIAGPMILGGVIGGTVGGALGKGHRGKNAAIVAGTLIGASIAHDAATRRAEAGAPEHVEYVPRCRVTQDYHTEERIEGYEVSYRYRGETFTTRLPYDPGKRLRLRVDVTPVLE